jgi:integrase
MAHVRRRGSNFTITASLGDREDGSQIRKNTTFKPPAGVTPAKAEKLAREYAVLWENQIRGYVPLDENKTLKELADWYFETQAPMLIRPNVAYKRKSVLNTHIYPKIGNIKLKHITPQMLDALFMDIKKNGYSETVYKLKDRALLNGITRAALARKAGVSNARIFEILRGKTICPATANKVSTALGLPLKNVFDDATPKTELMASSVNAIKIALSAIFTQAVKKQLIKQNPCRFVTTPKNDTAPADFLDEPESKAMLDIFHAQGNRQLEVIVNLFLASGMRAGELFGLRWENIDLETGLLRIKYTLVKEDGEFVLHDTKTTKSNRRIKLPAYVVGLLADHKRRQDEIIASCHGVFNHCGAVFTNETGGYICRSTVSNQMKRVIREAGLKDIHLHTLRHTHASLLINSDVAAKVVADRLGHADTRTTLNIYTHIFEETEAKALRAVEMKLFQQIDEAAQDDGRPA